jgi:hypothetical protein
MGIERVFMARNADSALKLGQARGAIVAAAEAGLEIAEYTATQVKQAVAGTGGANKEQVMMMVMHLLKLTRSRRSMPPMPWPSPCAMPIPVPAWCPMVWARVAAGACVCGFSAILRVISPAFAVFCRPRLAKKGSERDWTFARHPGGKTAAAPDSRRQRLGYELEVPMTTLYRLPKVGEP